MIYHACFLRLLGQAPALFGFPNHPLAGGLQIKGERRGVSWACESAAMPTASLPRACLPVLSEVAGSRVEGRSRLSKVGSPRIRKALYMPALVALRYNPIIRKLAQRLAASGKQPMVIV